MVCSSQVNRYLNSVPIDAVTASIKILGRKRRKFQVTQHLTGKNQSNLSSKLPELN